MLVPVIDEKLQNMLGISEHTLSAVDRVSTTISVVIASEGKKKLHKAV